MARACHLFVLQQDVAVQKSPLAAT